MFKVLSEAIWGDLATAYVTQNKAERTGIWFLNQVGNQALLIVDDHATRPHSGIYLKMYRPLYSVIGGLDRIEEIDNKQLETPPARLRELFGFEASFVWARNKEGNRTGLRVFGLTEEALRKFVDEMLAKGLVEAKRKEFTVMPSEFVNESNSEEQESVKHQPLNRILYGPPGTGKTYATRVEALSLLGESIPENRDETISRYEELLEAGQIRFVTFHPSLAYEDFIEGLRPKLDGADAGSLSYTLRDGIFKSISKDARRNWLSWKNKSSTKSFDELWEIVIQELEASDGPLIIPTPRTKFEIYGIDDGVIRFRNAKEKHYTMSVRVLEAIYDGVREIPGGLSTYYAGLLEWLKLRVPGTPGNVHVELKQYVLIIDEINRGNIPSIFGELITLLEPSKRAGMSEPLEVVLPTSQERFQVPPNLHVLGTMNTADRSVEALDVALRRRFDFVEMMPDPQLLGTVADVDLKRLLETINVRLEALVDRDHTIGHAFFMGVQDFEDLKRVFGNKVIPLLQEFFYGDWRSIGLVLGQGFVQKKKGSQASLFARGFEFDRDLPERYELTSLENWTVSDFQSIYAS